MDFWIIETLVKEFLSFCRITVSQLLSAATAPTWYLIDHCIDCKDDESYGAENDDKNHQNHDKGNGINNYDITISQWIFLLHNTNYIL